MRISSTDKIHNPLSPKYKRTRAGRKGIGRFATQRLGDRLTIITQTFSSTESLKLTIDWNRFELDKDLNMISNEIEEISKERKKGTKLIIERLRDSWTEEQIKRIYKYSSEILQPFPLSKKDKKTKKDPGFKASFYKIDGDEKQIVADEETMFYKHSLAEIDGYVNKVGRGAYKIKSKLLGINKSFHIGRDRENDKSPFRKLRNVHFKTYYFIYEPSLISKQVATMIREAGREYGGIRLYRNGFRVLPYGEKNNDWLGLDESVQKRQILSPHGNNNFFGFVEINEKEDENFQELSSREGILKDDSFEELVDFIFRVIISSVNKISEYRERKKTAGQKNWKKQKSVTDKITEVIKAIDSISFKSRDAKRHWNIVKKELIPKLNETANEAKQQEERYIDESAMLKVLAGLGLTMAEFVHEIRNYIIPFGVDLEELEQFNNTSKFGKILSELNYNYNSFAIYTSYFDKIISRNVNREIVPNELRDVVNDFLDVVSSDNKRSGIKIVPKYDGYDLFTTPMHPSEWASILFNLYTNSKKAIKKAAVAGKILIKAGQQNDIIHLEFIDNGTGIKDEYKERIFDAFFTTTSSMGHHSKYYEDVLSTGLGLKIIKDIVSSYGGEIYVKKAPRAYKTCLRIELPKATDKELKEYDL